MLDAKKLAEALPHAPLKWLDELVVQMLAAGIDTPNEVASFVAQLAHESNEFRSLSENLNYRPEVLMRVWPSRFPTLEVANQYAHNPELLANKVYGGRLGNVNPGDGWKYRGRGPIQVTGKANYAKLETSTGMPVVENPDLLLEPGGGIRSALWYWKEKKLDLTDDDLSVLEETKAINGGIIGLDSRQAYFDRILRAIS